MNSKSKAFTLHSSSSLSNLFKHTVPDSEKHIITKLYQAQQKVLAVFNNVMQTASETRGSEVSSTAYYLTLEKYKDAVWAARTLREVDLFLRNNNNSKKYLSKNFKTQFDFESSKVKANKYGKIYLDTTILVQLMDLHRVLAKVIDYVQATPPESYNGNFSTGTEVSLDSARNADRKLTDLLADLENSGSKNESQTMSKEILTALSVPLHNKFMVMPVGQSDLPPLTEEQISESMEDVAGETRKTKSASSLKHNEVTDAAGARRIIIRCLSDLDKVKNFLYTFEQSNEVEEPATEDEEDRVPEPMDAEEDRAEATDDRAEATDDPGEATDDEIDNKQESKELKRDTSHVRHDTSHEIRDKSQSFMEKTRRESNRDLKMTESERKKCCCAEDCPADQPLEFTWKEGDEASSKLVICIKGKSEEDGDVHVVIRQCPECKLIDQEDLQGRDKSNTGLKKHQFDPHTMNYESQILHGKEQDLEDCPLSSSEDMPGVSRNNINVIFDPKDPSNSRVEGRRSSAEAHSRKPHPKPEEAMSRIRLNETVNLNLQTDQGQDLVISLTVRPKTEGAVPKLSITDIFSDSRTNVPERDRRSFDKAERGPNERGRHPSKTRNDEEPSREDDADLDVTIPLSRTKVCSSLEFDVQVVDSRMKSSGIKHTNPNIVVRLNDMGVNNLLRACRPVKCGRKAILNESLRKCLPYSPSLKSLPLEEYDADIIDQSLSMSIKKSKHSTIFIKDDKLAYTVEVSSRKGSNTSHVKQVYFVQVATPNFRIFSGKSVRSILVERILGYYINIEKDITFINTSIMEVRYFEIEDIRKRKDVSIPATILSVRLKNSRNSKNQTNGEMRSLNMEEQALTGKEHSEKQSMSGRKHAKCSSRIPVYKYRYKGCKKVRSKASQVYDVSNQLLHLEKEVKGCTVDFKKLNIPSGEAQGNKNTLPVRQHRSKSVLTIQNDKTANQNKEQMVSNETAEYFNKFMRYISLLNSTSSTMKNEQRKKREFYTSRSHSSILMTTEKGIEYPGRDSRSTSPNTKVFRQHPDKSSTQDATVKEKCIRLNDVILSSTRFKKQLNNEKTTSRIIVNRLSNFLYENFIKGVSPETRIEIMGKIDFLLNVYSRFRTKNGVLRGRKDV